MLTSKKQEKYNFFQRIFKILESKIKAFKITIKIANLVQLGLPISGSISVLSFQFGEGEKCPKTGPSDDKGILGFNNGWSSDCSQYVHNENGCINNPCGENSGCVYTPSTQFR
jgi:hypothetical protein